MDRVRNDIVRDIIEAGMNINVVMQENNFYGIQYIQRMGEESVSKQVLKQPKEEGKGKEYNVPGCQKLQKLCLVANLVLRGWLHQ